MNKQKKSSPAPQGYSLYIATGRFVIQEWARQDSNLGPTDYESAALTAELQARVSPEP
jgi:hypothetical protein